VNQKRPIWITKDMYESKETYTNHTNSKRPIWIKRDVYESYKSKRDLYQLKVTHIHHKRRVSIKRALYEEKETCNRDKRDLYEWKETYTNRQSTVMKRKRHATETFLRYMGGHHTPTNMSKETYMNQKRSINQ